MDVEFARKIGLKMSEWEEVSTCVRKSGSECEVMLFGWNMFGLMFPLSLSMSQQ